MLAADVLARVNKLCEGSEGAMDRLSVLTLAQCMPLLGLMPAAHGYRRVLARARASGATWVDVSAPTDWGSFALIDPFAICLGAEEVRTLAQDATKTVADVMVDKITGWADVADENGQPVPYSAEALRQLLDHLGLAPLVLQAYIEASGAKAKN